MAKITRDRADRIARAHACSHCQEYSYKKLTVKPAPKSIKDSLGVVWIANKVCGVCDLHEELGLSADGEIVFSN